MMSYSGVEKPIVFLSHMHGDREVVKVLQDLIHQVFRDAFEVFNSSNGSIAPGENWKDKIAAKLTNATAFLVVFSPDSINRAWVNFECGVAWGHDVNLLIPCLVGKVDVTDIPSTLNHLSFSRLDELDGLHAIACQLAEKVHQKPPLKREIKKYCDRILSITQNEKKTEVKEVVEIIASPDIVNRMVEMMRLPLLNELSRGCESVKTRRKYFEDEITETFQTPIRSEVLREAQIKVISTLLEDPVVLNDKRFDTHCLRYNLGEYLGELKGIPEKELITTIPLDGDKEIMRYMITRGMYKRFKNADNTNKADVGEPEYYFPWCPVSSVHDTSWFDEVESFRKWIRRAFWPDSKEVRLPTCDEWCTLADPGNSKGWELEALRNCNLNQGETQTRVAAVGVFRNGKSKVGGYDVIGNVWELCYKDIEEYRRNNPPTLILGWSYKEPPILAKKNWNKSKPLNRAFPSTLGFYPVGVRFVIVP